ncbi:carboxypeptidase-like regulatory domain-containing protein [Janthinobacterium sp. SUN137]|uniref:carboxypeptidase-like regulatory domain-containing protein n=1 Tax=Janthinobacterium sp. SUN137 TaxID=3014789 RepID=UPI00271346E7|nr:carboxypeptidase-like regulatory domain-containing protein [Janthinobacterium sp. SUN137]MDO8042466.1 carboxypeptidase-like regulatory domain-containing protein [Janthinobacterium sp. SUN137]
MSKDLVEGCVLDELGKPVAGAYVTIHSEESEVHDIASITGVEGKFRLVAPCGNFSLTATTKSGLHGMARLSEFSAERFAPIIKMHY